MKVQVAGTSAPPPSIICFFNFCWHSRRQTAVTTTTSTTSAEVVVASTSTKKQVVPDPLSRVRQCKSHAREEHHFFLNYRVWSEGNKHPNSSVCSPPSPSSLKPSLVSHFFSPSTCLCSLLIMYRSVVWVLSRWYTRRWHLRSWMGRTYSFFGTKSAWMMGKTGRKASCMVSPTPPPSSWSSLKRYARNKKV